MLDEVLSDLASAVDAVAAVDAGACDGQSAAAAVVALEREISRLTAISARLLPTVEAEVAWGAEGFRSVMAWFASATGLAYPRARARVELGRASVGVLALSGAAAASGDVPVERVETMTRLATTTPQRCAALAGSREECGEPFLLGQAQELPAESFTRLVRRWAAAADPDADERGYREATEREFLTLSRTTHGVHLAGLLTAEHGAALSTALTAVMGPPTPGDCRTTTQRRAQALADCARLVLDHGLIGTGAAVRPHLTCVVDFATLSRAVGRDDAAGQGSVADAGRPAGGDRRRPPRLAAPAGLGPPSGDPERFGVAELLDGGPVPAWLLARLACDSEISRVVFGPASQVIDAGRAERTLSGPRRRAVIARDRTCRFPGCSAPSALGEVHHLDHWASGGRSSTGNGVLLCWHHHDHVHRRGIEIRIRSDGSFAFSDAGGTPVRRAA